MILNAKSQLRAGCHGFHYGNDGSEKALRNGTGLLFAKNSSRWP
jgi:hypothetical protein